MTNAATKTVSEVAQAAKLIRAELTKAFPGAKFSIRSESFSMGNAVRISWTDGPAFEAVDAIAQGFTSGSFDGMTDCYNYDRNRKGPTAKYVTCTRRTSDELRAKCVADLRAMFAVEPRDGFETLAYRILRKADLGGGYAGVRSVDEFPGFEVISAATVSEAA